LHITHRRGVCQAQLEVSIQDLKRCKISYRGYTLGDEGSGEKKEVRVGGIWVGAGNSVSVMIGIRVDNGVEAEEKSRGCGDSGTGGYE
jgi:hypothetical protein